MYIMYSQAPSVDMISCLHNYFILEVIILSLYKLWNLVSQFRSCVFISFEWAYTLLFQISKLGLTTLLVYKPQGHLVLY